MRYMTAGYGLLFLANQVLLYDVGYRALGVEPGPWYWTDARDYLGGYHGALLFSSLVFGFTTSQMRCHLIVVSPTKVAGSMS